MVGSDPRHPPHRTVNEITTFWRAFMRAPRQVGAIMPSSKWLARAMTDWVDWPNVRSVVEFGAGTGRVTSVILNSAPDGCRVLLIERDENLAAALRRKHPHATVVTGRVQEARRHCDEAGLDRVDAVISTLPWASYTRMMQRRCLAAAMSILQPDGVFATFAQLQGLWLPGARWLTNTLPQVFDRVERSPIVWLAAPPSVVYQCYRPRPA